MEGEKRTDGDVTEVRAVSGSPLLVAAAVRAVSREKFEPAVLDGDPTPIVLKVEIDFDLMNRDLPHVAEGFSQR